MVVVSDTTITCVTPVHPTGLFHTTVTTPSGTSTKTASDDFTFIAPVPVLTRLTISRGPVVGGTTIQIMGSGFTGATAVNFGSTPGTSLVVNSDTLITVVSPSGSVGVVDVTVVTPGGTSATSGADQFNFTVISTGGRRWFPGMRRPIARAGP
jgi:large repetitive protein